MVVNFQLSLNGRIMGGGWNLPPPRFALTQNSQTWV